MKLNPNAAVRVEKVLGSVPVLYIEDFYADPMAVREQALQASFDSVGAIYPGRHSIVQTPEAFQVLKSVCAVLTQLGDNIYDPHETITDFSIVVAKPDDLITYQKHPHIDPTPVLGIVYLNPVNGAGTSFYRNKILDTAVIVTDEHVKQMQLFNETTAKENPPNGYDLSGHPCWERVYQIEGRFNRLVVYPGNVYHAVDIQKIPDVFSMETVRLTQRIIPQRCTPKI